MLRQHVFVYLHPSVTWDEAGCPPESRGHAEHLLQIQQAAWRVFTRLRYGPALLLLPCIVAASPASSFSTAGLLSEITGKSANTVFTNENVTALSFDWANTHWHHNDAESLSGYLLCNKDMHASEQSKWLVFARSEICNNVNLCERVRPCRYSVTVLGAELHYEAEACSLWAGEAALEAVAYWF